MVVVVYRWLMVSSPSPPLIAAISKQQQRWKHTKHTNTGTSPSTLHISQYYHFHWHYSRHAARYTSPRPTSHKRIVLSSSPVSITRASTSREKKHSIICAPATITSCWSSEQQCWSWLSAVLWQTHKSSSTTTHPFPGRPGRRLWYNSLSAAPAEVFAWESDRWWKAIQISRDSVASSSKLDTRTSSKKSLRHEKNDLCGCSGGSHEGSRQV